jgi:methyl-accepting chemotaxis protein
MFSPAVYLMNRLSYTKKFSLVGSIALLVILFFVWDSFTSAQKRVTSIEHQLEGITYATKALQLFDLVQRHQAYTNTQILKRDKQHEEYILSLQKRIDAQIEGLNKTDAQLQGFLAKEKDWQGIPEKWKAIKEKYGSIKAGPNLNMHLKLNADLLATLRAIHNKSGLYIDDSADSLSLSEFLLLNIPETEMSMNYLRDVSLDGQYEYFMTPEQIIKLAANKFRVDQNVSKIKESLPKITAVNPDQGKVANKLASEVIDKYVGTTDFVLEKITTQTGKQAYEETYTKAQEAIVAMNALKKFGLQQVPELLQEKKRNTQASVYLAFGLALAAVLTLIYLFVGMYSSIKESISKLVRTTQALAAGDLTVNVEADTYDEMRQVSLAFNQMTTTMRDLIRQIHDNAAQVSESADQLSHSSSTVANSSEQQTRAAVSMAASVEQLTASIEQVGDHANEAQMLSRRSGDEAESGSKIINETVNGIRTIASSVGESTQLIQQLGKQSNEISLIVKVIKEIAGQTNLLALNAAIEAARAGEQGRGFAVVADEVRKLAERTTSATQEIADMIGKIQSGTRNAVTSMEGGVSKVEQGVQLASKTNHAITEITSSTGRVMHAVSEISLAIKEQTLASQEISNGLDKIAQMTEENNFAIHESAQATVVLKQLAENLQAATSRFRV